MEAKSKSIEKVSKPEIVTSRSGAPVRQPGNSVPQGTPGFADVQRAAGNLAVQHLARFTDTKGLPLWTQTWRNSLPPLLQMQSSFNQEEDIYEQEADSIAEMVVREDEAGLSVVDGKTNEDGAEEERIFPTEESTLESGPRTKQRSNGEAQQTPQFPPAISEVFRSGSGQPLDTVTRSSMEEHLGFDFRDVRLHTDALSAQSARAMNALAFTVGQDIVFDTGQYAPGTRQGRHLLAHELTHVLQHQASGSLHRQPASIQRAERGKDPPPVIRLPKGRPVPPLSDEELLRLLEAFPPGKTFTLYHVDETGDMIKQVAREGRITLKKSEFWLSTTVEHRTGFKQGAGLETILALELDARFVALLAERAMRPRIYGIRGGRTFQKRLFGFRLPIPKYHFEGGGRKQGRALEGTGEVNISIPNYREWVRLLNLSLIRADHLRSDPSLPEGKRLVHVQQLIPPLPPTGGHVPPKGIGSAGGAGSGGFPLPGAANLSQSLLEQLQQLQKNTITPLEVKSLGDLHDPKIVGEIIANNKGFATLKGVIYLLSSTSSGPNDPKQLEIREVQPAPLALSGPAALTRGEEAGRERVSKERPSSGAELVLHAATMGKGSRLGTRFEEVGEFYIIVGGTEELVVDPHTKEVVRGIFSGGVWYRISATGKRPVLDIDEKTGTVRPITVYEWEGSEKPEEFGEVNIPTQAPTGGLGTFRSGAASKVGAAGGLLAVINDIMAPAGAILNLQRNIIARGKAEVDFWIAFGGQPDKLIWDDRNNKSLSWDTQPRTKIFGSAYYPYVADIKVDSFQKTVVNAINSYQEYVAFMTLADENHLGAIVKEGERYFALVNKMAGNAQMKVYDVTATIQELHAKAIRLGNEQIRAELRRLAPNERSTIYRLRLGSQANLYRSQHKQPITNASSKLGPEPWVRVLGPIIKGGRVFVEPANLDTLMAVVNSEYDIDKKIEDVLEEVREGGRAIKSRQPQYGPLESFVAGPEGPPKARFGETTYRRDPESPYGWTKALGELKKFYVDADELEPISAEKLKAYLEGSAMKK